VIRDALRRLWAVPAVADPPVRVWRDWVLLAGCLVAVTLEGLLRQDVVWRPVSVAAAVGSAFVLLERRRRPLPAVLLVFGAAIVLSVLSPLAGGPIGLNSMVFVIVLVYALFRWGSGRDLVLGTPVLLLAFAFGIIEGDTPPADAIAGFVFLSFPEVLGITVRLWTTSRHRELEQVRSREREQFARELHDTVAHHVSAMVVRAQAGRVAAVADPGVAVLALEGIEEEGARTLEEMRAMVGALRDGAAAALAPLGGVSDLERLARVAPDRLRVDVRLDGDLHELPAALDAAVYRIVQESVTNAVRHATGAGEVLVHVVGEPDRVLVTVRDDGAPASRGRPGYGLAGMRERAALLGGALTAGPGRDGGWLVEAELPVDARVRGRLDRAHPRADR
jgi:signal transduction histidine kinase